MHIFTALLYNATNEFAANYPTGGDHLSIVLYTLYMYVLLSACRIILLNTIFFILHYSFHIIIKKNWITICIENIIIALRCKVKMADINTI